MEGFDEWPVSSADVVKKNDMGRSCKRLETRQAHQLLTSVIVVLTFPRSNYNTLTDTCLST